MPGFVNGPEYDEPGRLNADMEFEDAMRIVLNAELRESGRRRDIGPAQSISDVGQDGQVNV